MQTKIPDRTSAFGCPLCGSHIELQVLAGRAAAREFGCGLVVPLVAVCPLCVQVFTMDAWRWLKSGPSATRPLTGTSSPTDHSEKGPLTGTSSPTDHSESRDDRDDTGGQGSRRPFRRRRS